MMTESDSNDDSILHQIRIRPSMYIGATGQYGMSFLVGELVSNSIDQFLTGEATSVSVQTNLRKITVVDNGAGLPFDHPSEKGNSTIVADYMTTLHHTPTADSHAPHIHIHSCQGMGLAVVNALSELVEVRSWRTGTLWQQTFARGKATSKPTQIEAANLGDDSLLGSKGTEITFVPDREIFKEIMFNPLCFRKRMFDSAHLFAGLKVGYQDETFYAPEGLAALAATTLMNGFGEGDPLHIRFESEKFQAEVLAFSRAGNTNSRSENAKRKTKWMTWANGWDTSQGGTHKDACQKAFDDQKWKPKYALVHIVMKEPEFAGPTMQKLDVSHIEEELFENLLQPVEEYCQTHGQGKHWKHYRPD